MSDEWSYIANWFKTLANQMNIKLLMTLCEAQETSGFIDAPIYDIVTLASEVRETKEKTDHVCRALLERGLVRSPNNGYIKGQKGFRINKDVLPEIQLSSEGLIATYMIHSLRNKDNLELSHETLTQISSLQFLNKLQRPLKEIQGLVNKRKEELGQSR